MVLAGRAPEPDPLVSFDVLDGWMVEPLAGAQGRWSVSVAQRVWESPTGRLRYRGTSNESSLLLRPPRPLPVPAEADTVTVWVYGNNWGWAPDATTPPVDLALHLTDRAGKNHRLLLDRVRWKEWWLIHRRLPPELLAQGPLELDAVAVEGCANPDERELYFENLVFLREELKLLVFQPRPRRGIDPFPGQSPGANVGPGRLPFPTREDTILPTNRSTAFRNEIAQGSEGFVFIYRGDDGVLEYSLTPGSQYWGPVAVRWNGAWIGTALTGAGPRFEPGAQSVSLVQVALQDGVVRGRWAVRRDSGVEMVESDLRIRQKSLVVDFRVLGGAAVELSYGRWQGVRDGSLIAIPYLNYSSHVLNVLAASRPYPWFASIWMDWYRSNGSQPYAVDQIKDGDVHLNGGIRYLPLTDGRRNDLFERFLVTVSPVFEETLPTIPNPPAWRGREAGRRLWQETWGPEEYAAEIQRSRRLKALGIDLLTQCNHEITWRDGGESFTFRTVAAPGKGGDRALRDYVADQKELGWRVGLYTNYTDFAPVNAHWDPDMVMRDSSGNLIRAWPRCYSPKALFAVEADRVLAPQVRAKYDSNAAYTDVHTSVGPWERTDYDARVPGAGTFAATFYAYGELLLHDQEVYDGFCWSEGHHQWLYAGLTTGNYALTYTDLDYRDYPYLPHFDLLSMHPLTVDIGMPWTAFFFRNEKGWDKPERIDHSVDRFLAATIAYGHLGWLVEETHGIRRTARSYYLMQQLQSRYAMEPVEEILYQSGAGMVDTSTALANGDWKRSRLQVRYRNGLTVWINGDAGGNWVVESPAGRFVLPPFGWLALQGADFFEASSLVDGARVDRMAAPDCLFLDGRGQMHTFSGLTAAGSVAVKRIPPPAGDGVEIIAVEGVESLELGIPAGEFAWDDVRSRLQRLASCESLQVSAWDQDGNPVGAGGAAERVQSVPGAGWRLQTSPGVVRYRVACAPSRPWSLDGRQPQ
jgi:hypothetical protein